MYKNILIAVDNSTQSNFGIDLGIDLAKNFKSHLVGNHIYAAALHDNRFRQMEGGLPDKYKEEATLKEQRVIHDSLINKGLKIISDSFLDVFEERCKRDNISYEKKALEGKNFKVLVEDVNKSGYHLVIIGALGLGAVKSSIIGSVCERVVRRVRTDILVVRNEKKISEGKIFVLLDGSQESFGGLKTAIDLSKEYKAEIEVISSYDPFFHDVAFKNIVNVLSEEAANIFKFKEQERLHEEIINSGLAKIYQSFLDVAKKFCDDQGVTIKTKLLAGKAYDEILDYVKENNPALVVMGRIGIHNDETMDIGSNTENILRLSPVNLLISSTRFDFTKYINIGEDISWSKEAEERIKNIPPFALDMAKMAIKQYAISHGHTIVTSDIIDQVMKSIPRGAMGKPKQE